MRYIFTSYGSLNNNTSELSKALIKEGFKNIQITEQNNNLFVSFENNVYRFETKAISKAINIIINHSQFYNNIILVVNKLQIPIVTIKIAVEDLMNFKNNKISKNDFYNNLSISFSSADDAKIFKNTTKNNKSILDIDFVIKPKIGFQLGNTDYPFRYQFRLLPSIETSLWKGQKIIGQFNIPVFDRQYIDQYNYIRPNIISFEQNFRLSKGLFSKFTLGWFSKKRYGIDAELVQYLFNGKLLLRGNIGYTGYILYIKKGEEGLFNQEYSKPTVEFDKLNYIQYFANIEYRIEKYDLIFNVGYGKYLYENTAYTVNVERHFGEYILGFQAHFSKTGNNYGFHVSIPLWPEKYFRNKKIRVRTHKYINYSYLATRDYIDTYSLQSIINEGIRDVNPIYFKKKITENCYTHIN